MYFIFSPLYTDIVVIRETTKWNKYTLGGVSRVYLIPGDQISKEPTWNSKYFKSYICSQMTLLVHQNIGPSMDCK